MMRSAVLAACAALAVAGCDAPGIALNPPSSVQITKRAENQFEPRDVIVRAFAPTAESGSAEVAGAQCTLRSGWVRIPSLVTPGVARVPTYLQGERFAGRGKPPALTGSCTYQGKTVPVRIEPTPNVSNTSTSTSSSSSAGTATLSTTRLNSKLNSTLPWYYPSTRVDFGTSE